MYSATDAVTGMKVAIKIINKDIEQDQQYMAEGKILKELAKLDSSLCFPRVINIGSK